MVNVMLAVAVVLVVVLAVALYREKNKPVPVAPVPEPKKKFGRDEAVRLSIKTDGLTPQVGKIAETVALIVGLPFTVREECAELAAIYARQAEIHKVRAEELRTAAASADVSSAANSEQAAYEANLAANFAA